MPDLLPDARAPEPVSKPRRLPLRKTLGYALILAIHTVKRLRHREHVAVSPNMPKSSSLLWKLSKLAGLELVDEATARRRARPPLATIRNLNATYDPGAPAAYLNGRCRDISKSHVDAVFGEVFGYATKLDPTTFAGRVVMKPEINGLKSFVFVECPIAPAAVKPDFIYQRFIDNAVDDNTVKEYRAFILGSRIVDVQVQLRDIARRLGGRGFGGGRGFAVHAPEDVFTPDEQANILGFCARLGLEYGELDILPDIPSGRIYILDANKTPSSMVDERAFTRPRFRQLMSRADAFRQFLRTRAAAPEATR